MELYSTLPKIVNSPRVAIIVLNYNGLADTSECLRSVGRIDYPTVRVLVVDNHSADDSVAHLRKEFPHLEILEREANGGFAAGSNTGIRRALTDNIDYVWLLNNDTVVAPDALRHLVTTAEEDASVGVVGCQIYDMTHRTSLRVWGGGRISLASGWGGHLRHRVEPERLGYLTAASMLIRAQALRQVGLFDEGFFMYCEDIDLCFRLRRGGWKLAVAENAVIYHKEGASFREQWVLRDALVTQSEVRLFQKYAPSPSVPILVRGCLRYLKRLFRGEWRRSRTVWVSTAQALRDVRSSCTSSES